MRRNESLSSQESNGVTKKIGALIFYAVLAALAITQAGTLGGTVVNWIIVALVVIPGAASRFLCQTGDLGAPPWDATTRTPSLYGT